MIDDILEKVANKEIDIKAAKELIAKSGYADLGGIKLDMLRKERRKFAEVVYCKGKTDKALVSIFNEFIKNHTNVMGTKASLAQYNYMAENISGLSYNEVSQIVTYIDKPVECKGVVAICSGGNSDMYVAEEAAETAEFMGAEVRRFYDVGVAGIHRLLASIEEIRKANVIVAVAGMEGALAGVISGLVKVPVIAVPTSVGYGASFGGVSALLTMLNSCSEGISVVNIDNGFGAGYIAAQINSLIVGNN